MNLEVKIEKLKEIHINILEFIENEENIEENFQNLLLIFNVQKIKSNKHDLISLFHLTVSISNNHHHDPSFYGKIEMILDFFKYDIKSFFSNSEIFNIFKSNKRILLFLIENQIIVIDKYIIKTITSPSYKSFNYPEYFSPEIKPFINEEWFQEDHKNDHELINQLNKELPEDFYENRKIGENESSIAQLVRKDSVKVLITYINKNDYSLKSTINQSIYETNQYLIRKKIKQGNSFSFWNNNNEENESKSLSLIEYAAFVGANQIFNYLRKNNFELTPSLWMYAIHGQNAEIIRQLEETNIKLEDGNYFSFFIESIKCHHNNIANYINNNYIENIENQSVFIINSLKYHNYSFIKADLINQDIFYFLCKYNYPSFVKILFENKEIDPNQKIFKLISFNSI